MRKTIITLLIAGVSWSALPAIAGEGQLTVTPADNLVTVDNQTAEPVFVQVNEGLASVDAGTVWTVDVTTANPVEGVAYWAVWSIDGTLEAAGTYTLPTVDDPDGTASPPVSVDPHPPVKTIRYMSGGRYPL